MALRADSASGMALSMFALVPGFLLALSGAGTIPVSTGSITSGYRARDWGTFQNCQKDYDFCARFKASPPPRAGRGVVEAMVRDLQAPLASRPYVCGPDGQREDHGVDLKEKIFLDLHCVSSPFHGMYKERAQDPEGAAALCAQPSRKVIEKRR